MKKFLDKVRSNSVEGRKPAFATYRHWFVNNVESDIDDAISDKPREWNTEMFNGISKYRNYSKHDFEQLFKSQSSVKEMMDEFKVGMKALENQKVFDKVMYGAYSTKTKKYMKDYQAYDKTLVKAKKMSLKNQQMPRAVENNPKLIKLAESMLRNEVKKNVSHMRIVRKFMHNKVLKFSDGWYLHRWDSFIVAFVEKKGNKYFIKKAVISKELENRYSLVHGGEWDIQGTNGEGVEIPKENIR